MADEDWFSHLLSGEAPSLLPNPPMAATTAQPVASRPAKRGHGGTYITPPLMRKSASVPAAKAVAVSNSSSRAPVLAVRVVDDTPQPMPMPVAAPAPAPARAAPIVLPMPAAAPRAIIAEPPRRERRSKIMRKVIDCRETHALPPCDLASTPRLTAWVPRLHLQNPSSDGYASSDSGSPPIKP